MQQHQESNFATFKDSADNPVWDTFFVLSDWGNGDELFAFRSPLDRKRAMEAMEAKGMPCQVVSHQEAFHLIQRGMNAWIHHGDIPKEDAWDKLSINYRVSCVA